MSDFYDPSDEQDEEFNNQKIISKEEARKAYSDGMTANSQMARLKSYKRMTKPMRDDYERWYKVEQRSRTILYRYFSQDEHHPDQSRNTP